MTRRRTPKYAALFTLPLSLCLLTAVLLCLAPSAAATTKTWIGGTGQWDTSGNWSPSGQPLAGDTVNLTQSDATNRTVTYYNTTNPTAVLYSLKIDATGTGAMTLDMPYNHLLKPTTVYIGYSGKGAISLQSGAQVSSTYGYLGYNSGSTGTATVTGTGSKWTNSDTLYVGFHGNGTLNIQGGGQVSSTPSVKNYLGNFSGATGTVTVTGTGSKWTNTTDLYVGNYGNGALNVEAGGQVGSYRGYLGYYSGSTGTATVTGSASAWNIDTTLYVGYNGSGTLNIEAGGQVSNSVSYSSPNYLGYNSGSTAAATVTGSGSAWTCTGPIEVGYKGNSTLNIEAGGQVKNTDGYLGHYSGTTGTATVTGAESKWTNSGILFVGYSGTGELKIQEGGQVSNAGGYLGYGSSSPGTATVTGTGSKWINSGFINVGYKGSGTLNVEAGGQVINTDGYLGRSSGSTGTAKVTGTASNWTNSGSLYVGYDGNGTLTVADGGQVSTATLYASLGNLLGNGAITVTQGAILDADMVFDAAHGTTTTLTFGSGGTLNVSVTSAGTLGAGYKGTGTLRIVDGVTVASATGYLGYRSGSTGTATVTGFGSTWSTSGELYVGCDGNGTLNVEAGGQISNNTYAYLGGNSVSTGTVTVTGAGSKWTNDWGLYVGNYGNGVVNVEAGGEASIDTSHLGLNSGSTGTVTVKGAGSTWTSIGYLVGEFGNGTLNVQAGGHVSNTYAYLGRNSGSTGTVTVDGSGSLWNNAGSLCVGGDDSFAGGSGSVTVQNSGQLTVGGTLKLWKADSTVTVSGGTLVAGSFAGTTGTLRITDPTGGTALTVGSTASDTFSGTILDDTGPGSLTKVGSGMQTLSGANAYTGTTTVRGGVLRATSGTGLPAASNLALAGGVLEGIGTTTFTRDLGTSGSNTVQWTGNGGFSASGGKMTVAIGGTTSPTPLTWGSGSFIPVGSALIFGSLTADKETEFGNSINLAAGTRTITVNDNPATTADFATISGTLSNGGLTKDGAGLLVLKGSHTYTGATTISAGTLKLASGATLESTAYDVAERATFDVQDVSGGFTLATGKTLKGSGMVLGTLVADGTVMPGSSPGILMVENITFASDSTLQIELGGLARGTEYDVLSLRWTLTMQSGSTLAVSLIDGFVPQRDEVFDILDFAGHSGEFGALNLPQLGDGLSWDTSGLYTSGTITVAPEPMTLALVVIGVAAMAARRRKR